LAETKAFAMGAIDIWRVADGRLIEHRDEPDTLDSFTRSGA
jgi:predicted SnoaL-like aldol condensation-catalyzing enzyme